MADENDIDEGLAEVAAGVAALGTQLVEANQGVIENGSETTTAVRELTEGIGSLVTELREARAPAPADDGDDNLDADEVRQRMFAGAADTMTDPWTRDGYETSDFEMCWLIQGGMSGLRVMPKAIDYGDYFTTVMRHHLFEKPGRETIRAMGADGQIRNARAMDAQEAGFGLELIGVEYVTELWRAARNMDTLVNDIRAVPMSDPTQKIPIDGSIPEMLFVGESTSESATAYGTSKTGSGNRTLTAKKFTIQQVWSGELDEDSIVPWVPFLREMLAMSAALHLGSAYLNGDTTNAGTGNINLDDADPEDSKHYLAFDGIRHYWLVDDSGQGKSMASAIDIAEINVARGKLNGGGDDIDNGITNINWGQDARDLRLVMDWDTYMGLLDTDRVTTIDKYGPSATVLTGELGNVNGIPIITPPYASKTQADGKASNTESSNTKGQITLFAPRGWVGGVRRETALFFDRIQRTDQFLFELYTRRAFQRHGSNVAAGIYNITV